MCGGVCWLDEWETSVMLEEKRSVQCERGGCGEMRMCRAVVDCDTISDMIYYRRNMYESSIA